MSNTTNAVDEILLVELVAYDPNLGTTRTLRYSSGRGHVTGPAETPADTFYDPRIKQALDIQRTMFGPRTTRGRSTVGYGAIVLYNGDGELDFFTQLGVDKRVITIRRGPLGGAYPSTFPADFVGTMANVEVTQDEVRILLRDRQAEVNVPLQTTKYTGAGLGTLEGVAGDIKGKPKPVCYGKVLNVTPVCVETAKLIYQVNAVTIQTLDAVYDRGVALADAGGSYASTTALLDNAGAPAAGQFKLYTGAEGAYFRLGSQPDGLVTASLSQGATAAARYAGQVFTLLLTRAGMSASDWNATDVTDLDTAAPYALGFWTDQETTVAAVLDQVAVSVGAAWFTDLTGDFRIQQLVSPSGSPVLSFTDTDIVRDRKLVRVTPNDQGQGVPTYQCIVRYAQNYTVQETDVAAAVTNARREVINKPWLEAQATDTAVQTAHPLAIQSVEDSLLTVEADAQAEATRRQALRGVARDFYEFVVQFDDDTAVLELNDVIELIHSRYGLGVVGDPDTGAVLNVLGLAPDAERRELLVTAWGPTQNTSNRITQDSPTTYRLTSTGAYRVTA